MIIDNMYAQVYNTPVLTTQTYELKSPITYPLKKIKLTSNIKSNDNDSLIGWNDFLQDVKKINKADLVQKPEFLTQKDTLSINQSKLLKKSLIILTEKANATCFLAIKELKAYLDSVTNFDTSIQILKNHEKPLLSNDNEISIIAIGYEEIESLIPKPIKKKEGYSIKTFEKTQNKEKYHITGISSTDLNGLQYGIYRFMNLSGKRFFYYMDSYTPPVNSAIFPINNFEENYAPPEYMKERGFSPHTYHPIPLSIAFHIPSEKNLAIIKKYIDWHIQNGQNYIMFPMLELDKISPFIPLKNSSEKFKKWLPHAKEIVNYAHSRGVKISIKLAFANYVSANTFAITPFEAISQSNSLDTMYKEIKSLEKQLNEVKKDKVFYTKALNFSLTNNHQNTSNIIASFENQILDLNSKYDALLKKYTKEDKIKIEKTIDDFMQVNWDEITWNLGTSEFSPTNDDLTINWMNTASNYLKQKYPNTVTSARSHIPPHPFSEKYNESYFQLIRFTDPSVGNYVHTTHLYSLIDPAPVYGNQSFEEKLKYLYRSTKERKDIYYPETSYWVTYDVNVPIFLPVYILSRKHDMEIIKKIKYLDGELGFTTGWEWGYWFNDYALAQMQLNPDKKLTQIIDGACAIFGKERNSMTNLLQETMLEQQKFLIEKQLMKYMSGFSPLTDFGASIKDIPVVNKIIQSANSTPIRVKPSNIMKWDENQLNNYEKTELLDLAQMLDSFDKLNTQTKALKSRIPDSSIRFYDEIADGMEINYLRSKQSYLLFRALVTSRKAKLEKNPLLTNKSKKLVQEAENIMQKALKVIKNREKFYRDAPEYTYAEASEPTMWPNRYLTSVHTGEYWKRSMEEVKNAIKNHDFIIEN